MSSRTLNGNVQSGLASFTVLNSEGWAVTAAHVLQPFVSLQQHATAVAHHRAEVEKINTSHHDNPNRRRNLLKRLPRDDNWVTHASGWWGAPGVLPTEDFVFSPGDVALVKLSNHEALNVTGYPHFKVPSECNEGLAGMSLVKVGYPFTDITATWSETTQSFNLGAIVELPMFPIDGIVARIIEEGEAGGIPVRFVETSSPGLSGQSGGPILDSDGLVHAMQSRTKHYELGFSPEVKDGTRKVTEHQFLNAGWGVHASTLKAVFDSKGVNVQWE